MRTRFCSLESSSLVLRSLWFLRSLLPHRLSIYSSSSPSKAISRYFSFSRSVQAESSRMVTDRWLSLSFCSRRALLSLRELTLVW